MECLMCIETLCDCVYFIPSQGAQCNVQNSGRRQGDGGGAEARACALRGDGGEVQKLKLVCWEVSAPPGHVHLHTPCTPCTSPPGHVHLHMHKHSPV
eukprot:1140710-Pelagomonas_calceolata.AAC.1